MKPHCLFIVATIALFLTFPSFADSPPPPPADWDLRSANGKYLLRGDLKANNVTVSEITDRGLRILWSVSPWQYRAGLKLSNDGASLAHFLEVGIREGLDQEALTMIHRGAAVHTWYLRDFFRDSEILPKSVSHMQWVKHSAWDKGELVVTTVDGQTLRFDGITGKLRN